MLETSDSLLLVEDLAAGYGKRQVLRDVNLNVSSGEIVALIGHNGAGKSTLLKAVFGLLPVLQGRVILNKQILKPANPRETLLAGVAYLPQGNRVFGDLTVRENLEMGGVTLPRKNPVDEGIERAFNLFPALKNHLKQKAGTLSGGEQQMLALGIALVLSPKVLLLDEPSLGLAPPLVSDALARIQEISRSLDMAILIVEQKVREVLTIAKRVYVLRNGSVSFSGPTSALADEKKLRESYL